MANVRVLPDAAAVAAAAAELFVASAAKALTERESWTCALSGGSTPRATYELLARPPLVDRVNWGSVHLFWGDERHVPPDDPDSNYRMVSEALLKHVPIPADHVHRVLAELPSAAAAAAAYEDTLRAVFKLGPGEFPHFDFVLLGMGPDGHTASLFPNTPALSEQQALVVANPVAKLQTDRITLTLPVLNNAREIVFLVTGQEKAAPLAAVLQGERRPDELPSQSIQPVDGSLTWLVDTAAADQIG
jgi:6-phosphogluconolactonase